MQQKSLGLIETQGLAAGIEAADAAVKSANVELVGYELTKGGGWTTIKILGDVGAVKAAVDAARIAAGKVSRVVSTRVIARPSMGLTGLIHNTDTVGDQPPEPPAPPALPTENPHRGWNRFWQAPGRWTQCRSCALPPHRNCRHSIPSPSS